MRQAARSLSHFVGRHRRAVGIVWLVAIAAALPFAMKQTENLTGGGFEVPGSESAAVEETMQANGTSRTATTGVPSRRASHRAHRRSRPQP